MKAPDLPEGLVAETLKSLGIEVEQTPGGGELVCLCPGHKAVTGKTDHKPSWSINEETGLHHCFSCGYRGNLFTLVRDMNGLTEAKRFWADRTPPETPVPEGWTVDRSYTLPTRRAQPGATVSENTLAMFVQPPEWALQERRLSDEVCRLLGIKWSRNDEAWVLPLRDPETDALMGYQLKGQRERLMRNRPTGMRKGATLFGWREARDFEQVVVVESPLDAALLTGIGYPSVAVCGSKLTSRQRLLLHRIPNVVLALDNDEAGRIETNRFRSDPGTTKFRYVCYRAGDGKDPGELSYDGIESLFAEAGAGRNPARQSVGVGVPVRP